MERVRKVRRLTTDLATYHAELLQRIERKEKELQAILHEHMRRAALPLHVEAHRTTVSFTEPPSAMPVATRAMPECRRESLAETLRNVEVNSVADNTDTNSTQARRMSCCNAEAVGALDPSSLGATDSVTLPLTGEQRRWQAVQMPSFLARRGGGLIEAHNDENVPPPSRGMAADSMQLSPIARLQSCMDRSLCTAASSPGAPASLGRTTMPANDIATPSTRKTVGRHVRFSTEDPLVALVSPDRSRSTPPCTDATQPLASPRTSVQLYLTCLQNLRHSLETSLRRSSPTPMTRPASTSPPPPTALTGQLRDCGQGSDAGMTKSPSVTCANSDTTPDANGHALSPILLHRPRAAIERGSGGASVVSSRSAPVELPSTMSDMAADKSVVHLARRPAYALTVGAPRRSNKRHARSSAAASLSHGCDKVCAPATTRVVTAQTSTKTGYYDAACYQERGYTASIVLACGPTQYFD